jgi:hypothetical protein
MPALPNARQERFAQALALGLPPREAYERAGYTPGARAAATAARLLASTALKARMAELAAGAASVGKARPGAHGVTASADTALDKATSNGSRSNGAVVETPAQKGAERRAPNGAPVELPSDTTATDTVASATSAPATTAPSSPTPGGATVASLIAEFEEARQLALEVKQPAAAVSATMSKARISGLIGEKTDAKPGDRPLEMSDLELGRRMALLLTRGLRAMPDEATH